MTRLPDLGPRGEGWVLLQFVLLALLLWAGIGGRGAWTGPVAWFAVLIGGALMLSGATLAVRGMRDLGRNLTPVPRPRAQAQLVETGIFARVRHPIYGGLVVGALGWSLLLVSLLAVPVVVALTVLLDLKSRREEAWLLDRFPGYDDYMARTRRLIPWVY